MPIDDQDLDTTSKRHGPLLSNSVIRYKSFPIQTLSSAHSCNKSWFPQPLLKNIHKIIIILHHIESLAPPCTSVKSGDMNGTRNQLFLPDRGIDRLLLILKPLIIKVVKMLRNRRATGPTACQTIRTPSVHLLLTGGSRRSPRLPGEPVTVGHH